MLHSKAEELTWDIGHKLCKAALGGDVDALTQAYDRGANLESTFNGGWGWGAIHAAAYHGHLQIICVLAKLKADLNKHDEAGRTALIWTVIRNDKTCTEALLSLSANPDVECYTGKSAIFYACEAGNWDLARLLQSRGANVVNRALIFCGQLDNIRPQNWGAKPLLAHSGSQRLDPVGDFTKFQCIEIHFAKSTDPFATLPIAEGHTAFLLPGNECLCFVGSILSRSLQGLLIEAGHPIPEHVIGSLKQPCCSYHGLHHMLLGRAQAARGTSVIATPREVRESGVPVSYAVARLHGERSDLVGATFLSVFRKEFRPLSEGNAFLMYGVGSIGKRSARDIVKDVFDLGVNMAHLILDYNYQLTARKGTEKPKMDSVRLPILGDGASGNPGVTGTDASLALLWGIHSVFGTVEPVRRPSVELMPGNAMRQAYKFYMAGKQPSDWSDHLGDGLYEQIPQLTSAK